MDALELQQEFNFAQMLQGENAARYAAEIYAFDSSMVAKAAGHCEHAGVLQTNLERRLMLAGYC